MQSLTFDQWVSGIGRRGGAFVNHGRIRLYLSQSSIIRNGVLITNVDIHPRYQKQGLFSAFLEENKHLPIKIGCVVNSYLEAWLVRQEEEGYWYCEDPEWIGVSPSFHNQTWAIALAKYKEKDHDFSILYRT